MRNSFGAASTLKVKDRSFQFYRLEALDKAGIANTSKIPYSIRILLENLLRFEDDRTVAADIEYVAKWDPARRLAEIKFRPARVLLQDFTGVPCVVDLAAMRDALRAMGADPKLANPLMPADLVIDHSVQVDHSDPQDAFGINALLEFQRNRERYMLLRWGQTAFQQFPRGAARYRHRAPGESGISGARGVHEQARRRVQAYPDTLVGTDSHTTMINGLGVVGWGVGGIEAEACMLGQPISMLLPPVVGFKLHGQAARRRTATDLVLTVTQMLRKKGVVGKFVEFYGAGVSALEPGRPRHHRQHGARVRRDDRLLPGRRRDARLPAVHQPRAGADRAGGGVREGAGPVPHGRVRPTRCTPTRWNWIWRR